MPSKNEKARVLALVDVWKARLGLQNTIIHVDFEPNSARDTEKMAVRAVIEPNLPYQNAHLTIYDAFFDQMDNERILLHELTHLLTAELRKLLHRILIDEKFVTYDEAMDADELVTDRVTNVIWRLTGH